MSATAARAQWEASNSLITSDVHWEVDKAGMEACYKQRPRPWIQHPKHFTSVRMSALAALKILMHAKTGQGKKGTIGHDANNWIEVMGLMQGHFKNDVMVVTDAFALPVDATEVECSMNDHSVQYMLAHLDYSQRLQKAEGCIGWYHSHPGYSCFLSGIDVRTQRNNQLVQDPWLAVVVDPVQTAATGKIEIRAFRTLPERVAGGGGAAAEVPAVDSNTAKTPNIGGLNTALDTSSIPPEKIAEYGVYVNEYYELPITLVRSSNDARQLDQLWSKYWTNCLATASPLVLNRPFMTKAMKNMILKMNQDDGTGGQRSTAQESSSSSRAGAPPSSGRGGGAVSDWLRMSQRIVADVHQGLELEATKKQLFG